MKKEAKAPPPESDDIDVFEEWEEASDPVKDPVAEKPPEAPKPKPQPQSQPKPQPQPKPAKSQAGPVAEEVLHMSADVPVHLVAVIGRTTVSVKDMMGYQMGQVIDLGRPPGETVDLVASGKLFARGELVDIDGKLGVRIVKLVR